MRCTAALCSRAEQATPHCAPRSVDGLVALTVPRLLLPHTQALARRQDVRRAAPCCSREAQRSVVALVPVVFTSPVRRKREASSPPECGEKARPRSALSCVPSWAPVVCDASLARSPPETVERARDCSFVRFVTHSCCVIFTTSTICSRICNTESKSMRSKHAL